MSSIVETTRIDKLQTLLAEHQVSPELFPMEWLKETDFFRAPASTKYHAAYPGGLFDHCYGVTKKLLEWTSKGLLSWGRSESPIIIGMLHDVTKIGAYAMKQDRNPLTGEIETWWEWNNNWEALDPVHGMDSVMKVSEQLELTYEEWACIRWHMGAYETVSWDEYDKAIKEYPNVLWTHTADMYASKIMEVRNEE